MSDLIKDGISEEKAESSETRSAFSFSEENENPSTKDKDETDSSLNTISKDIVEEECVDESSSVDKNPEVERANVTDKIKDLHITSNKTFTDTSIETNNNSERNVQNHISAALSCLQGYGSSSDENNSSSDTEIEELDNNKRTGMKTAWRNVMNEDSEGSDGGSDSNGSDIEFCGPSVPKKAQTIAKKKPPKTKGELDLDDLPPVPDLSNLTINNKEDCFHMGNVDCIIDKIVTVDALPNMPAYDLDTLLFLDKGERPLGHVFDVMGPVHSPIYVIRFNNTEDIQKLNPKKGDKVYCIPKGEFTQYVFLQQLLKIKGSDASWKDDNEVPPEHEEYSDDEFERERRRAKKGGGRASADVEPAVAGQKRKHSVERYRHFETNMNKINRFNTRVHKIIDSRNPFRQRIEHHSHNTAPGPAQSAGSGFPPGSLPPGHVFPPGVPSASTPNGAPMYFDPSVPPPGYNSTNQPTRAPDFSVSFTPYSIMPVPRGTMYVPPQFGSWESVTQNAHARFRAGPSGYHHHHHHQGQQ